MQDVQFMEAMKAGQDVLKDLQNKVTVEDFEEMMDEHKDQMELRDREAEIFGEVLN